MPAMASPGGQFAVHVLGTVPALLGAALLLFPHRSTPPPMWQIWFTAALVTFSLLSLVPIPMSDGGHVLDEVLLPRAPRLSFGLQVGAEVLLTLVAGWFVPPLLVSLLALAPATRRAHRLMRLRERSLEIGVDADTPEQALRVVSDAGFDHLPYPERCSLAAELLAMRPGKPLPAAATAALALAYLLLLAAVPVMTVALYRSAVH
jgi:hypothetical protein